MNEMNTFGYKPGKELRRTRHGKIVAGVCSGAGEFLGVDANILRLALGVATFFGGLGVGIYAVAWLLIPQEGKITSIVQDLIEKQKTGEGTAWQQASEHWQKASSSWQQPSKAPNPPSYADQPPYADAPTYGAPTYNDPTSTPQDRPQPPVDEPPAKA
ncbi:PspC domain-containing protein [Sphaerisporangium sp. TRM90804]|uniref:PspC domain-containing protein n=1 Tax=Sphaerisporangium sp. TRM90804 TaxID=3031113 RepID=UPI00244CBDF5|nr:PspC domain-containing protein [Sphaerisporangium sp. TRM90804]MDH2429348.1 PspC domain-containing protein [Sphaerisporangium sp. TRM90804]